MVKRNNKRFWENFWKAEISKQILGWFLIILTTIFLISFIYPTGILTSKINDFFYYLFGWNKYLLIFIGIFWGFSLIKKLNWSQYLKFLIGGVLIFSFFNFYFHLIFREGGILGNFLLKISQYIGLPGAILLSLTIFTFSLWLILEEKFFDLLKFIFQSSKETIKEAEKNLKSVLIKENIKEPIKVVKKEVPIQNDKNKLKLQTRKILPKSIWKLPPIELLPSAKEEVLAPDIKTTSQIIEKTLENFGIKVEVVDAEVGPAITRFALKPGEGVKLSKILSYQSDLALALGTSNIIIETPIPGKPVFGLQVPNKKTAVVRLGNLLREKEFYQGPILLFPIGRKIDGQPLFADLSNMPHLLIAGSTGSGKSIFIHDLLISLLMKNTPETLNLILIDPKRVELINYADLPHLIMEPIVEIKKSVAVFNWLIEEMEERYKLLQETRSRDIESYNQKQIAKNYKIMPRIVLVIDELADLMISYSSNIESAIIRLTQMARATGIHLVLATQRPSVDIVTGLIKANIPNRLCFKVASFVDSRTVLDTGGAEKLIGQGDGLFMSTTFHRPIRIKAPYVSENEIHKVVNFWKEQAKELPYFEKQMISLEELEKKTFVLEEDLEDEDLFNQAVQVVLEAGKASTSLLQRRLKIGYARAARLLDMMEEKGIVGPQEGSKPRKVLIKMEDWLNREKYR